ncbi:MAG: nitronate monooxygenase [Caulobacteraceae bacterium]|nr:nitronate monooxygenase [Caulobacteraceae bacterium]
MAQVVGREKNVSSFANNRVVQHTGADYPIIQAPMAWIARSKLVGAVSAAGAMGILETSARDIEASRREYDTIRTMTNRPFGINLAIKFLKGDEELERIVLDWALDGRVRFVTTSAGDPRRYIQRIHDAGVVAYHAVPSLEGALKAEDAGVDGLVVEGGESAGIRGAEPVHSLTLLQAVRERVSLPIVAAGGIADGRGMAAAFALGAEGVAMGTRFVASTESPVHENYKQAIVAAAVNGTGVLPVGGNAVARALKAQPRPEGLEGEPPPKWPRNLIEDLYIGGRTDISRGSAGETAGLIREVKPVADIVHDTVNGFWREIDRLAALRG